MIAWYSASTPPDGWLECNGQSTAAYPELAAIVGGTVPDLRGQFIRGWNHSVGFDPGRLFGSQQLDALQGHGHQLYEYHVAAAPGGSVQGFTSTGSNSTFGPSDAVRNAISDSINGNPRVANETRPTNVALLPCIKY